MNSCWRTRNNTKRQNSKIINSNNNYNSLSLNSQEWHWRYSSCNSVLGWLISNTFNLSNKITRWRRRSSTHRLMMRKCPCIWISWSRKLMIWRGKNKYCRKLSRRKHLKRWNSKLNCWRITKRLVITIITISIPIITISISIIIRITIIQQQNHQISQQQH